MRSKPDLFFRHPGADPTEISFCDYWTMEAIQKNNCHGKNSFFVTKLATSLSFFRANGRVENNWRSPPHVLWESLILAQVIDSFLAEWMSVSPKRILRVWTSSHWNKSLSSLYFSSAESIRRKKKREKKEIWLSFTIVAWVLSFFATDVKVNLNVLDEQFLLAKEVQHSSAGHCVSSFRHTYIMVNNSLCWIIMWNHLLSGLQIA